MDENKKRIDDLVRELDHQFMGEEQNSTIQKKVKDTLNPFKYFWIQFTSSALLLWNKFLSPIFGWFNWIALDIIWKNYRKVWDKLVYDAEGKFSRVRGAVVLGVTIFLLYFAVAIANFIWHTALYFSTVRKDEVVYLSNAQEVNPDENVFSVQGCEISATSTEEFSCGVDQSLYFRIDPTSFSQVWSILNNGTLFYPDYVAAPIAPGWQKCTVTSYGFRLKSFIRNLEIYPELLSATCGELK